MTIYIHCDGSCYNHPDHNTVGYAAVLSKKFDPLMTEVIETKTGWDRAGTNNTAEWLALLAGMELMIKHSREKPNPHTQYQIYTDSALVAGQANGKMQVRKNSLKYYYAEYRALEKQAHDLWFDIEWVSRKQNRAADAYSKLVNPYFKDKINNELDRQNIRREDRCANCKV
ncbi:hypothetical protein LCGC14_0277820 [marine sediment metagenome]|uniref:RNase H type-1 domain-containing protein n=1 Tax=marine sediment metagenome TaxID=412755 RepID=A0A0F9X206_9ZZZZ